MAYSIETTKLEGLHETLKQFVRELNEFAWDMRTKGLGVLMPEEIEIKVTLVAEDSGTFAETEVVTGGGKTTTTTTEDVKGNRVETVNVTDTDMNKQSLQIESNPPTKETATDIILSSEERTVFGAEVQSDEAQEDKTTVEHGVEKTTNTTPRQTSTSTTSGEDLSNIDYTHAT